jgi:lipid II:glycine glycyltransferase (peptidoglycan interpeptide bridge formation enzyme)
MTKEIILQQNHLLFNAYKDDKLLVSHFYLVEENMLFLVFSTSILPKIQDKKDEQAISMSSRYLHYQAMKYGKESGYKNLCFGSIGNDPDSQEGRVKFKLGFGGEIIKKGFLYERLFISVKIPVIDC